MTNLYICKAKAEGRCKGAGFFACKPHSFFYRPEKCGETIRNCRAMGYLQQVTCIPYRKETAMEYELLKPISIKALEEAGACESELHRFTFLATKEFSEFNFSEPIYLEAAIRLASQCTGGIKFLLDKGFIGEKEKNPFKDRVKVDDIADYTRITVDGYSAIILNNEGIHVITGLNNLTGLKQNIPLDEKGRIRIIND